MQCGSPRPRANQSCSPSLSKHCVPLRKASVSNTRLVSISTTGRPPRGLSAEDIHLCCSTTSPVVGSHTISFCVHHTISPTPHWRVTRQPHRLDRFRSLRQRLVQKSMCLLVLRTHNFWPLEYNAGKYILSMYVLVTWVVSALAC